MLEHSNKTAINAAWSFFKGNYALNFAAIAILIVLNLLGMIPIIGILFIFAYSIVSLAVQIYFGRAIAKVNDPQELVDIAAETKIGDLLTTYLQTAAGAFLGFFFIFLLFSFLFGIAISMSIDVEQLQNGMMSQAQMIAMMSSGGAVGLLLLVIAAFFFYFAPGVLGEIIKTDDFTEAFKKSFWIFSPSFWKRCFNKEYFVLIFIWSLILIGVGIVMVLMASSIILLPVVLVIAYIVSLYNAAIYVFAADLAKE
ncbi:hypothetical protein NitYY0826_C1339 [Nitratiruptor sp. YY08-26]|uniref:hypothetical protein n=1 Tax=unclassified Nitratiruptor TaxID=2624044 RepID=UPI0019163F6C|nr:MULTISPECIES: hypothetical protein [unclassified Nitratiruptor]BCD62463.1 hypothetical protein NitYY0813_C1337 [Nitratiruptor sp. YY08-13]BCD66399.1 hypothetical protein NitYY0826_C1339 [Nitratiruptor sp. YY08-26]